MEFPLATRNQNISRVSIGVSVIQNRWQFVKHLAKIFDLCVLIASFILAYMVFYPSNSMTFADFLAIRIKLGNCLLFVLLLIIWHNLFMLCGLYVSKRLTTVRIEILE